jgi:hypothetical protein
MQQRSCTIVGAAHVAATHPNPVPSPVIGMLVGGTPLGTHSGTLGTVGKAEGVAAAIATIATQSTSILEKVVCAVMCALDRLLAPACACFELACACCAATHSIKSLQIQLLHHLSLTRLVSLDRVGGTPDACWWRARGRSGDPSPPKVCESNLVGVFTRGLIMGAQREEAVCGCKRVGSN